MTVLVSVWGAASGVGKSTLCAGLSRAVAGAGLRVDHFREEEILSRSQFAAVAGEFGATGAVGLERLVAATGRFVASVLAGGDDVVIADALMPFVPTVLAMGHGEEAIDAFMADLTRAGAGPNGRGLPGRGRRGRTVPGGGAGGAGAAGLVRRQARRVRGEPAGV